MAMYQPEIPPEPPPPPPSLLPHEHSPLLNVAATISQPVGSSPDQIDNRSIDDEKTPQVNNTGRMTNTTSQLDPTAKEYIPPKRLHPNPDDAPIDEIKREFNEMVNHEIKNLYALQDQIDSLLGEPIFDPPLQKQLTLPLDHRISWIIMWFPNIQMSLKTTAILAGTPVPEDYPAMPYPQVVKDYSTRTYKGYDLTFENNTPAVPKEDSFTMDPSTDDANSYSDEYYGDSDDDYSDDEYFDFNVTLPQELLHDIPDDSYDTYQSQAAQKMLAKLQNDAKETKEVKKKQEILDVPESPTVTLQQLSDLQKSTWQHINDLEQSISNIKNIPDPIHISIDLDERLLG